MPMITHYKTKEEAEQHCGPDDTVIMEGNALPRWRVISKEELRVRSANAPFTGRDCATPERLWPW